MRGAHFWGRRPESGEGAWALTPLFLFQLALAEYLVALGPWLFGGWVVLVLLPLLLLLCLCV